jgi:hypothetical protein
MMDKAQIKSELTEACWGAAREWLDSTRGASALGANATVTRPNTNSLLIQGNVPGVSGPVFFEIIVKASM